jgi:hypothetical protein
VLGAVRRPEREQPMPMEIKRAATVDSDEALVAHGRVLFFQQRYETITRHQYVGLSCLNNVDADEYVCSQA